MRSGGIWLLLAAPSWAVSALTQQRLNLVLIVSDDQGYGGVHCYGAGFPTPHLDALRQAGHEQSTLVIFMSDNGADANFGGSNGRLRSGKATLFEGGIRVPCIMRWPAPSRRPG